MHKRLFIPALTLLVAAGCGEQASKPQPPVTAEATKAITDNKAVVDSIVRVDTETGGGTGFIIKGADGKPYVLTAAHVVANGGRVSVQRQISINDFDYYVEAYPDASVVAFDAEADLALLELRNVPTSKLPALELADPVPDESIASYGFGDSSLIGKRLGLTRKDGKLSTMVQLPVVDHLSGRVIKANAVKAIIVSSALEPGFSGGPTVNSAGKVVGVNVQKDDAHQAQNACVHATVVRDFVARYKGHSVPTTGEVSTLLSTIATEYLPLEVPDRLGIPEFSYVSLSDLPKLRDLADRVMQKPNDAIMAFSQIPGPTLPTLLAGATKETLNDCQKRNKAIYNWFKEMGIERNGSCTSHATRPLTWDLIAATLHWDPSKPASYVVTKVEEVDPVERRYTARIKSSQDAATSWLIHLVAEGSTLKLSLFDKSSPYAFNSGAHTDPDELAGRWSSVSPDGSHSELIELTANSESVQAQHYVRHVFEAKAGEMWTCSRTHTINYQIQQVFTGKWKGGVVVADADRRRATREGAACTEACNRCQYTLDVGATFKRVGEKLIMTRTDTNNSTEAIEFVRMAAST